MNRKTITALTLVGFVALGLGGLPLISQAQDDDHMAGHGVTSKKQGQAPGYGMGHGVTGKKQGQAPGYGMGHGYSRGYGMGGSGMMGMGGGMMGGHGIMGSGMGMMGGMDMSAIRMLDLTDQQRARINKIQDSLRKKNWNTMGKIMDEKAKLRDLYAADKRDPKRIGAVYGRIFDLKRRMIEAAITAKNEQEAILTKQQRKQLKQWRGNVRRCGTVR